MSVEDLHARLAAAGVPLFDAPVVPAVVLDAPALSSLLADLLEGGTASLAVAIPCLLVAQDRHAAEAVRTVAGHLAPKARMRLGLLHRMARSLAASRRPDIEDCLGRRASLSPWDGEPADLPDPAERWGDSCIREARDEEVHPESAGIAGDAERTFDQWLRILAVERGRA